MARGDDVSAAEANGAAGRIIEPNEENPRHRASGEVQWAKVKTEPVSWIWEPYIPLRKITLLEGRPGLGKSFLCCSIAAGVTMGKGLPGQGTMKPGNVLFLSAEDDLADTLVPRIQPMGANLSRIFSVTTPFRMDPQGMGLLKASLVKFHPSLVIFDPLFAYFGSRVSINQANETRALMWPLSEMATVHNCAILGLRHLAKAGGLADDPGVGSGDVRAAARSVLLVGSDPSDKASRVVIHDKSNLAPNGKALGYRLVPGEGFFWTGESTLTREIILGDGKSTANLAEVKAWLEAELKGGPLTAKELFAAGRKASFTPDQIRNAGNAIGVEHYKSMMTGAWTYKLPEKMQAQIAEEW